MFILENFMRIIPVTLVEENTQIDKNKIYFVANSQKKSSRRRETNLNCETHILFGIK